MSTPSITQAVILAGGQGSRLRPYTDDRPKPMVEIPGTGRSILHYQLEWLAEAGVTDVVISCGHMADVLESWLKATDVPLRVKMKVEDEPLGRGGGLKYAAADLPRPDEPWFATNGDIWTHFDLHDMAAFHFERLATATLLLATPKIPWGVVEVDTYGHVVDFIESPPCPWPINAGVYVFDATFAALLPDIGDHERTTFPHLARERQLAGFLPALRGVAGGAERILIVDARPQTGGPAAPRIGTHGNRLERLRLSLVERWSSAGRTGRRV
jgi:NDP-sugar pyrophosphorylase family protein